MNTLLRSSVFSKSLSGFRAFITLCSELPTALHPQTRTRCSIPRDRDGACVPDPAASGWFRSSSKYRHNPAEAESFPGWAAVDAVRQFVLATPRLAFGRQGVYPLEPAILRAAAPIAAVDRGGLA